MKATIISIYPNERSAQGTAMRKFRIKNETGDEYRIVAWKQEYVDLLNGFKTGDEVMIDFRSVPKQGSDVPSFYLNNMIKCKQLLPKQETANQVQPTRTKAEQWVHDSFLAVNVKHNLIAIDENIFAEIIGDLLNESKELTLQKITDSAINKILNEEKINMNRYDLRRKISSHLPDEVQMEF
jgi:hypothetical protein